MGLPPAGPAKRPGLVTAAAVIAFVACGLGIVLELISLPDLLDTREVVAANCTGGETGAQATNCHYANRILTQAWTLYVVEVLVWIAMITGGILALTRRTGMVLRLGAIAAILMTIWANQLDWGGESPGGNYVATVLILIFISVPTSRAWFRDARNGAPPAL